MAVYALFIAQNLRPIFEHYGGELFERLDDRLYIAMVLPFMVALCSIRNLRYLSPFSILANIIQGGPTGSQWILANVFHVEFHKFIAFWC